MNKKSIPHLRPDLKQPFYCQGNILGHVVLNGQQIQEIISRLALEIYQDYINLPGPIVFKYITNGATFLHVHLEEELIRIGFPWTRIVDDNFAVSSYGGGTTIGKLQILGRGSRSICLEGLHVLVIEDIIDTSTTLARVLSELKEENPLTLKACALIQKDRSDNIEPDYLGAIVPSDCWLQGGGMDTNGYGRVLPGGGCSGFS